MTKKQKLDKGKFYRDLGDKICIRRILLRGSQEEFAYALGLHQAAWCRIEKGTQKIELEEVINLCKKKLNITLQVLLSDEPIYIKKSVAEKRFGGTKQRLLKKKFVVIVEDEVESEQIGPPPVVPITMSGEFS